MSILMALSHFCDVSLEIVQIGQFQIEFLRIGSEEQVTSPILAFHGFGRFATDFKVFKPLLKPGQLIYSFHLFQHGNSVFPAERIALESLKLSEHKKIIQGICDHLKIDSFQLLGYSLGGKVALKTIELFPHKVKSVFLVAPDGVKLIYFYKFVSGTRIGRSVYRGVLNNPKPLFRIADGLRALRLLPEKLHRFVHYHMKTYESRKLVGEVWMIYRLFEPNVAHIQSIINSQKIPTTLIYGKYDSVIKAKQGIKLDSGLDQESLHILESGHLLLQESTVNYINEKGIWL